LIVTFGRGGVEVVRVGAPFVAGADARLRRGAPFRAGVGAPGVPLGCGEGVGFGEVGGSAEGGNAGPTFPCDSGFCRRQWHINQETGGSRPKPPGQAPTG
jgi:hypothetical protein